MTWQLSLLPKAQSIYQFIVSTASCVCPAALQVAILAAAAPEWEVRNAAHLAFAAVAIRILGYRNLTAVRAGPESIRRPGRGRSRAVSTFAWQAV